MLMRTMRAYTAFWLLTAMCLAQAASPASNPNVPQNPPSGQSAMQPPPAQVAPVEPFLAQLQQFSTATVGDLGRLRIDKWKTDSATKQQNQANADAISRNLNSALPGVIEQVRSAPASLPAGLKLYRNLNVLYDVLAAVAESAGAFGPRQDYQALAQRVGDLDQVRRSFADRLENLATAQEGEISRLQAVIRAQAAQAAAVPPKQIVVDDTTPAPKKKTTKKPARKPPATPTTPQPSTPQPSTPQ